MSAGGPREPKWPDGAGETVTVLDFLPDSYRRRRAQQQRRKLRRWAVAVALALMVAGGVEQRRRIEDLRAQQALLRQQHELVLRRLPDPRELRQTLKRLEAQANLVNYLRLRVPPTRLLACITNTLPPYVSLAELHVEYETAPRAADGAATPPRAKPAASKTGKATASQPEQPQETALPSESDIRRLLEDAERYRTVIVASGMAVDDLAVSRYLANLEQTGLFEDVRLVFTREQSVFDHPRRAFEMRLTLKRATALVEQARQRSRADGGNGHARRSHATVSDVASPDGQRAATPSRPIASES